MERIISISWTHTQAHVDVRACCVLFFSSQLCLGGDSSWLDPILSASRVNGLRLPGHLPLCWFVPSGTNHIVPLLALTLSSLPASCTKLRRRRVSFGGNHKRHEGDWLRVAVIIEHVPNVPRVSRVLFQPGGCFLRLLHVFYGKGRQVTGIGRWAAWPLRCICLVEALILEGSLIGVSHQINSPQSLQPERAASWTSLKCRCIF